MFLIIRAQRKVLKNIFIKFIFQLEFYLKKLIFIFGFISCSAQSSSVLDILKDQDNSFALQKELKKDIGSIFPSSNKPRSFIKAFEDKDFENALNLWFQSIKNTSFAKSSTGSALYAYLLFKNGFEVLSLKKSFGDIQTS